MCMYIYIILTPNLNVNILFKFPREKNNKTVFSSLSSLFQFFNTLLKLYEGMFCLLYLKQPQSMFYH